MKVLLISYIFAPQNAIAAIRTTKIAKYLLKSGYEVDVLCGPSKTYDPILLKDKKLIKHIEVINNFAFPFNFYKKQISLINNLPKNENLRSSTKYKITKKLVGILPNPISVYFDLFNSFLWYYKARQGSYLLNNRYDIILSSFGPLSSHLLGLYAKKKNKKSLWIADYRDPMINELQRGIIQAIYRYFQDKFLSESDLSFCVSDGLHTSLSKINSNAKIYTIRNGFDPEDIQLGSIQNNLFEFEREKFIFSYCGALYNGRRDLSPLFLALSNLISKKKVNRGDIEVHYAGADFYLISNMAKKYGLEDRIIDHGFVSRDKALQLVNSSDIGLVASWNTKNDQGVITGKVYELFLLKKTILCFISGDIANSELRNMIKSANAGYVYEEAIDSILELENQLLTLYSIKMREGKIIQDYDDEYVKKFSYNIISKQIDSVITDTMVV
jgi:glycosyltransferase involved in cell wall biosynthesis